MENLPQELIHRIVSFSEPLPAQARWSLAMKQFYKTDEPLSRLPRLAGLNRMWKEAVESITFHHLSIGSKDLTRLLRVVTRNRRSHVRNISFTAQLPEYSAKACAQKESKVDRTANNEAFTEGVRDLFTILRSWEDGGVESTLRLHIVSASSPTDLRVVDEARIWAGALQDIRSDRWKQSRLKLLHPHGVPQLHNVQHLTIRNGGRKFALSVMPDLAACLPNLKIVDWDYQDCELKGDDDSHDGLLDSDHDPAWESETSPKAHGHARSHFADKLRNVEAHSLHSVSITHCWDTPFDQRGTRPSIAREGLTCDPFSNALRSLSQCLTTLILTAHVDPSLFWPSQPGTIPCWPHLRSLDVNFNMVAPSGKWYFTGPQPIDHPDDDPARGIVGGVDERDYCYMDFRRFPDPETFDPLLAALAKAVAQMPVLESFTLTSDLTGDTAELLIAYYAPGKKAGWGDKAEEDVNYRRIYYTCEVGEVWLAEPETAKGLRCAGMQKYGGEAIERFIGSLYH